MGGQKRIEGRKEDHFWGGRCIWGWKPWNPPRGKWAASDSHGELWNRAAGARHGWAQRHSVPALSSLDEEQDLLTLSLGQEPRKFQMFEKCLLI